MLVSSDPAPAPAAPAFPPPDARAARIAKFRREQTIVDFLNRGVSIAEIAVKVGVGEKRMRAVVREILARRAPEAPEEFAAIQMSRLNEALLVAFSAMTNMNLKAVDQVIRIVRELGRYQGRAAALRRSELEQREDALLSHGERASPQATGEGLLGPDNRPEIPPQALENTESAPEFSAADASPALRAAFSRLAGEGNADPLPALQERASLEAPGEGAPGPDDRPETPPQALENTESTPEFSADAALAPPHRAPAALRAAFSREAEGATLARAGKGRSEAAPAPEIRPENRLQPFDKARFTLGPHWLPGALAAGTAVSRTAAGAAAAASAPPAHANLATIGRQWGQAGP